MAGYADGKDGTIVAVAGQLITLEVGEGHVVQVALNAAQDEDTGVEGGGVGGTRISPDLRFMMQNEDILAGQGDISKFDAAIEVGSGHGCLAAWAGSVRKKYTNDSQAAQPPIYLTDVATFLGQGGETAVANPQLNLKVAALHFGEEEMLEDVIKKVLAELPSETELGRKPNIVLLGAAVTYWECVFEPLAETIKQFCARQDIEPVALVGYFRRNWALEKRFFTKLLKGVNVEVAAEGKLEGEEMNPKVWAPMAIRDAGVEWNARVYKMTPKHVVAGTNEQHEPGLGVPEPDHITFKAQTALEVKKRREEQQKKFAEEKAAQKKAKGKRK